MAFGQASTSGGGRPKTVYLLAPVVLVHHDDHEVLVPVGTDQDNGKADR